MPREATFDDVCLERRESTGYTSSPEVEAAPSTPRYWD